ncbi:carboxyl transferase domain-containing protein [Halobacillus sp. K22]|uniref:carboxyl transferase domain-containing protein n=1 Tax=Halobacillus sp. K22 TaxID=3457431 RepID=UPI003FCDF766
MVYFFELYIPTGQYLIKRRQQWKVIRKLLERKKESSETTRAKQGSYSARERIDLLADQGSFLELGALAHSPVPGMEERTPADGLIGGVIRVDGREAVVQAMDVSVLSGTEGEVHLRKSEFFHSYAKKRRLPLFNLCEGGGLRMPDGMGSDGISDKLFPSSLLDHGRESPIMTAILGESYGGPTWMAVKSDFVTQVRGTSMAVAGPRMLEIANGEELSPEELGGPEMHAAYTGQIDHIAEDEEEAIEALRRFFSYMPSSADETPLQKPVTNGDSMENSNVEDIVPSNLRRAYDMKLLILRLIDNDSFMNFRAFYQVLKL